ncbi:hypothetical protein DV736_g3258, partial [Chaetothyriales sp. CBS 134916]
MLDWDSSFNHTITAPISDLPEVENHDADHDAEQDDLMVWTNDFFGNSFVDWAGWNGQLVFAMASDEIVWQVINQQFCSFKLKLSTKDSTFCRNEHNLTGFCNRQSCPLANSRYATVRPDPATQSLYLYIKTPERCHLPSQWWEKIRLPNNYEKALAAIDEKLIYWPKFYTHKCKQRLTRLTQEVEYVSDLDESDVEAEELEDFDNWLGGESADESEGSVSEEASSEDSEGGSGDEDVGPGAKRKRPSQRPQAGKKHPRMEIEYELEQPQKEAILA